MRESEGSQILRIHAMQGIPCGIAYAERETTAGQGGCEEDGYTMSNIEAEHRGRRFQYRFIFRNVKLMQS